MKKSVLPYFYRLVNYRDFILISSCFFPGTSVWAAIQGEISPLHGATYNYSVALNNIDITNNIAGFTTVPQTWDLGGFYSVDISCKEGDILAPRFYSTSTTMPVKGGGWYKLNEYFDVKGSFIS